MSSAHNTSAKPAAGQPHIIATSSKLKSAIRKRFTPVILSLA
ncbi:hypothetical protein [Paenibacillus albidus]|nr:hypothetical protein [Paenibacillus albidus]